MSKFGDLLRDAREKMGLDQDTLANRVGTTQQSVSRWEKGGSTPSVVYRARLAIVLNLLPDVFTKAVTEDVKGRTLTEHALPVRPLTPELPFPALPWDRFEELVEAVAAARHPDHDVSRVGGPGDEQHGFDVVVKTGTGYLVGYQVRRVRSFGPAAVRAAIAAATLPIQAGIIVLSRSVATSAALTEVHRHASWEIWDGRRLSRVIRELPIDVALRIVETFFPGHVEAFLGIPSPSPWQTSDEYFALSTSARMLSHDLPLVGQATLLDRLTDYATSGTDAVGLLVGRGGSGKSRMLLEVARRVEEGNVVVRLLKLSVQLDASHFALLPLGRPLLVIVDDCQDRDDLASIVGGVLRVSPESRILLAMRTYGSGAARAQLSRLQLLREDLPSFVLDDLTADEAATLAQHALGVGNPDAPGHDALVIGRLTADAPYLTVVAARSLKEGTLNQLNLASEASFRDVVLDLFADSELRGVGDRSDPVRRDVLDALSALQPFPSSDRSFQETLAEIVGLPYDRAFPVISGLEDSGVLLRRGGVLRIVPDLLGDAILTRAAADTRGVSPTGYVDRLWRCSGEAARRNLLVNACRAELHAMQPGGRRINLTESIWDEVISQVASLDLAGRLSMLQLLEKVGYFAPYETLAMIEQLTGINLDRSVSAELSTSTPSTEILRQATPPVLRNVAYNEEVLPQVIEMLWQLAKRDDRDVARTPNHPLRVLQWLAGFAPEKPLSYSAVVLDHAEQWLLQPGTASIHSPFDVIGQILATQGTVDSSDGRSVTLRRFQVNSMAVRPLRERVVRLALADLESRDLRRAARACRVIEDSLRGLAGDQDQEDSAAARDEWLPLILDVLERVNTVVSQTPLNPTVAVALRRALLWHLEYSQTATRNVAHGIISELGDDLEVRLAQALFEGWTHLDRGRTGDFAADEAEKNRQIEELTGELLEAYEPEALLDLIEFRLSEQQTAFERLYVPDHLIVALSRRDQRFGVALVERVAENQFSVLQSSTPRTLAVLFEVNEQSALRLASRLSSSELWEFRWFVATALGLYRGTRAIADKDESALLDALAKDDDPTVRGSLAQGIGRLADADLPTARRILCLIPFEDSVEVADEVFAALSMSRQIEWRGLTRGEQSHLLGQLEASQSLDGYWIGKFMAELARIDAEELARLFMGRIERAEESLTPYISEPIPMTWQEPLNAPRNATFSATLRNILDWMNDGTSSSRRQQEGGRAFCALAGSFDESVRELLLDWASVADDSKMGVVASTLIEIPANVVTDNPDFICRLLRAAERVSEHSFSKVASSLQAAVSTGRGFAGPGGLNANDLELERRSREIAASYPRHSPEERFYLGVADSAHRRAHWFDAVDRASPDGRDWGTG